MKIPKLVILRADMKETNALLLRIAVAIETAVGIVPPGPEAQDADRGIEVSLSSDADLIRADWERAMGVEDESEEERPASLIESFRNMVRSRKE